MQNEIAIPTFYRTMKPVSGWVSKSFHWMAKTKRFRLGLDYPAQQWSEQRESIPGSVKGIKSKQGFKCWRVDSSSDLLNWKTSSWYLAITRQEVYIAISYLQLLLISETLYWLCCMMYWFKLDFFRYKRLLPDQASIIRKSEKVVLVRKEVKTCNLLKLENNFRFKMNPKLLILVVAACIGSVVCGPSTTLKIINQTPHDLVKTGSGAHEVCHTITVLQSQDEKLVFI